MFYVENMSRALRFGDVVQGFPLYLPVINTPPLMRNGCSYHLEVDLPFFCVVLSPCCSIGESKINVCPLTQIRKSFLKNPYLAEDLTRLNRIMTPEQAFPPEDWERFTPEEQACRKPDYSFLSNFIYAPNDSLNSYSLVWKEQDLTVGHYMIDFRDTLKIKCDQIKSAEKSPLHLKRLELSVETRRELREKISHYYHRPSNEDRQVLDAMR